jgi:hypothetical protein
MAKQPLDRNPGWLSREKSNAEQGRLETEKDSKRSTEVANEARNKIANARQGRW